MNERGEHSRAEFYALIRGQIDHHDDLVNQRTIWQIISQSFFFGAYATLLNAQQQAKNPLFEAEQLLLLWLLPLAGIVAGGLSYVSITASLKTIDHLHGLYDSYSHSKEVSDPSAKLLPPIQGPAHLLRWAKVTPTWMPILFTAAWLIVMGRLVAAAWPG